MSQVNIEAIKEFHLLLDDLVLPNGWERKKETIQGEDMSILFAKLGADTLRLPLRVKGNTKVEIGFVSFQAEPNCAMELRVGSNSHWRRARPMRFIDRSKTMIQNARLGEYQIGESDYFEIRPVPEAYVAIAYVHLDQSVDSEKEVRHLGKYGVVFDVNMIMSSFRLDAPDDLYNCLAPYVDSDVTDIFWGTGVGTYSPLYFSDQLGYHGRDQKEFMASHRELTAKTMRMFASAGKDPFAMAVEFCHENGLRIWANDRISKNHRHDFRDDFIGGRFLLEHEDKLVKTFEGEDHFQCNMSFAYPEIREMKIKCLIEQAKYGVDGLYIDFNRKCPVIGWEDIVVDEFKDKYGKDPKTLSSSELRPLWMEHACSYLTQFLRDLKSEFLREFPDKKIPIAGQVPGGWSLAGHPNCMLDAMDPVTWAKEGLIDMVSLGEWTSLMYEARSLDRWKPLLAGTNCQIWGTIEPQFREGHLSKQEKRQWEKDHQGMDAGPTYSDTDPWRYMRAAADYYNQDADGILIWEAQDMPSVPERWNIIKNMGDKEKLNKIFSPLIGPWDGRHNIEHHTL